MKTGGEVGSSTVYFMWDAKQGGGFSYPYTQYASFDVSTGPATSLISQSQIWNGSNAWAYPGMGVDSAGNLGVSIAIGGGTWGYPGSQFLLQDDVNPSFTAFFLDSGAHANNRWGDFLTSRAASTPSGLENTWIVTGFTLHDSNGSAVTVPHFYWLGRQRDDPFAPLFESGFTNGFVEGAKKSVNSGYFYGASNCTCDYSGTNNWGDAVINGAGISPYPGFPDYFLLTGSHTYAEEGTYTTTLGVGDKWGDTASGNGTSSVSDAALSSSGTSITGAANQSLTKVVATFTDADPGGTVSDYSASIKWGDGTSSAGVIGSGFKVTGTHTYASGGTYTLTTSIKDVGGASTTATGSATIYPNPTITSFTPTSGAVGTKVTIKGTNLSTASSVTFNGTTAKILTDTATKITTKVPSGATTGKIQVTTLGGTATSATKFKVT